MNAKVEKWKNTLYYYRPHIIIGALVLAAIILGIWLTGPSLPDADLNVAMISNTFFLTTDDQEKVTQEFQQRVENDINNDGQTLAYVDFMNMVDTSPEGQQSIELEAAVGESRLLILDQERAQGFGNENYMENLSAFAQEHGLETMENPYVLPLAEDSFLSQYFDTEGLYACVKVKRLSEEGDEQVEKQYENVYAVLEQICEKQAQ